MSRRSPSLFLLAAGWALFGCGQVEADHPLDPDTPASQQHRARVRGQLVFPAGLDQATLDATLVRLFPAETDAAAAYEVATDVRGNFLFAAVDPGLYRLHAAVPGHSASDLFLSMGRLEDIDVGRLLLRVDGEVVLAPVRGRARLRDAQEHGGITVAAGDSGRVAVTADDGRFVLDVPPGDYTLHVHHPGYVEQSIDVSVPAGGIELEAQVLLPPAPGSVSGHVALRRFGDTERVGVVSVTLEGVDDAAGVSPPGDGCPDCVLEGLGLEFAFGELDPGAWTLTVRAEGYDAHSELITVGPGEGARRVVELAHASTGADAVALTGEISLADGAPPGGTRVAVRFERWDLPFATAVADVDGEFSLAAAPDEPYQRVVDRDGYDALTVGPVAYDPADGRFEDEAGAPISLTLQP